MNHGAFLANLSYIMLYRAWLLNVALTDLTVALGLHRHLWLSYGAGCRSDAAPSRGWRESTAASCRGRFRKLYGNHMEIRKAIQWLEPVRREMKGAKELVLSILRTKWRAKELRRVCMYIYNIKSPVDSQCYTSELQLTPE